MLRSALILLFGTFFLASLLTPAIYSAIITLWPDFPWPFARVYDRVAMVCVAILVYFQRRNLDLISLKGYLRLNDPFDLCLFTLGLLVCFSSSLFVLPVIVERGFLAWDPVELQGWFPRLAWSLPPAMLISVLEESFFRAMLFQSLKKSWSIMTAAIVSSSIYGLVHFITPARGWVYPGFSPLIGFEYLGAVLERMLVPSVYFAFVGLFLVGMVLCYVLHSTGRFYLCVGMHAGWVLALKFSFFATDIQPGHSFDLGAGRRYFLVAEPLSWLTIFLIFVASMLLAKSMRGSRSIGAQA